MKHNYYPVLLLLLCGKTIAQSPNTCASDWFREQAVLQKDKREQLDAYESDVYRHFKEKTAVAIPEMVQDIRTIPVVVHIVHDNGPENLSDFVVGQGIAWLNDALANSNYFSQGSGADTKIRLCLAQRTPDNQPTNGITHTQSSLTNLTYNTQDGALKDLVRWDPHNYLNIWVVREVCNSSGDCSAGGYTTQWADHGSDRDGIVIEARTWGTDVKFTPVVAHEVGHYFSLFHTFQYGCYNADCLQNGDHICDTPPDQSTAAVPCGELVNSCSTDTDSGPFTTDQPDMTWNYMDYGTFGCMHDFTPDQAERMNFNLSTKRKQLLLSKGCRPPCPLGTFASFIPGQYNVMPGQQVQFNNLSLNAAAFIWSVNGQVFSSQLNPVYTFTDPGAYTIELQAIPADTLLCDITRVYAVIQVRCPVLADFTPDDLNPQIDAPVSLQSSIQGATGWEWFVDGVSQGSTLDVVSFHESGEHEVVLVANNGLCSVKTSKTFFVHGACDYQTYQRIIQLPGNSATNSFGLIQLQDQNILYAASSDDSLYLIKSSIEGEVLWSKKTLGGANLASYSSGALQMCATADNGFAMLFSDSLKFHVVAKFSPNGDFQWSRTVADTLHNRCMTNDLKGTSDGNLIVCGGYEIDGMYWAKLDLSGNLLWANKYLSNSLSVTLNCIVESPHGGYYAAGRRQNQWIVVRIRPDGNLVWKKSFSIPASYNQLSKKYISYSKEENALYLYEQYGSIIKLDSNGTKIWIKTVVDDEWNWSASQANGMTLLSTGELLFYTQHYFPGDGPSFYKIDKDGNVRWARQYEDGAHSPSDAIALPDGGFISIGQYYSSDPALTGDGWIRRADMAGLAGSCETKDTLVRLTNSILTPYFHQAIQDIPPPFLPGMNIQMQAANVVFALNCADACANSPERCNNSIDDDADGLSDCLDPSCDCYEPCENKRNNVWCFGGYNLDFNFSPPSLLPRAMNPFTGDCSSICDESGRLLLFSEFGLIGHTYNRLNVKTLGGFTVPGGMLVPHPLRKQLFYLISTGWPGTSVNVIDMEKDAGFGEILQNNNLILSSGTNNKLAVVKSCNSGYWVIFPDDNTDVFNAAHLGENGANPNLVESLMPSSLFTKDIKASPDGRHIAVCSYISSSKVYLFDFDPVIGEVSNPVNLTPANISFEAQALEFSPDGRFLYFAYNKDLLDNASTIVQYDLEAPGRPIIWTKNLPYRTSDMQTGPDRRIYVNVGSSQIDPLPHMDVINSPNNAGANCHYQKNIFLPQANFWSEFLPTCIASDFLQPRLKFVSGLPDTVCAGETYGYKVYSPSCYFDSISWSVNGLQATVVSMGDSASIRFENTGAGSLVATGFHACGELSDTLSVVVVDANTLNLDLGPDKVVCDNGVVILDAGSGFVRYKWNTGNEDSQITLFASGKYWVDVWDVCGRHYADTIRVIFAADSALNIGPDFRNKCPNFTWTFEIPSPFASWNWTPNIDLDCNNCQQVTIHPASSGRWVIVGQTLNGCISVDTLNITIVDSIAFEIDTFVCSGHLLGIFGSQLPPDTVAIFFRPASGTGCDSLVTVNVMGVDDNSSGLEVTICPNEKFEFQGVSLPADTTAVFNLTNVWGCDSTVTVTINAYPGVSLSLPPDTTLLIGARIALNSTTQGSGALQYHWTPAAGLNCTNCPSPVATPLMSITYVLEVRDANNCLAVDSIRVTVNDSCDIRVPSAFTPNGDGANDRFKPLTDPCVTLIRQWEVVNRWGQVVFNSYNQQPNDPESGWDGLWLGKPHPSEVLIWKGVFEMYDGKTDVRSGEVTLLR